MSVDNRSDDVAQVVKALGEGPALAPFWRLVGDLDFFLAAVESFGMHKSGFGCGGKRAKGKCRCGLDAARRRAGLPVTFGEATT